MSYLLALAEHSPQWPSALKLALDDESAPQLQVAARMRAEGDAFIQSLRTGVLALQDALAWNLGRDPLLRM